MAVKERRALHATGGINTGNQSAWIDLEPFSKAAVMVDADATGCTVDLQTTNDPDGSNVYTLTALQSVLAANASDVIQVNPTPRYLRIAVTGSGNLDSSYIEGIREIA